MVTLARLATQLKALAESYSLLVLELAPSKVLDALPVTFHCSL